MTHLIDDKDEAAIGHAITSTYVWEKKAGKEKMVSEQVSPETVVKTSLAHGKVLIQIVPATKCSTIDLSTVSILFFWFPFVKWVSGDSRESKPDALSPLERVSKMAEA